MSKHVLAEALFGFHWLLAYWTNEQRDRIAVGWMSARHVLNHVIPTRKDFIAVLVSAAVGFLRVVLV